MPVSLCVSSSFETPLLKQRHAFMPLLIHRVPQGIVELYVEAANRHITLHTSNHTTSKISRARVDYWVLLALDRSDLDTEYKFAWYDAILHSDIFTSFWIGIKTLHKLSDSAIERFIPNPSLTAYDAPTAASTDDNSSQDHSDNNNDAANMANIEDHGDGYGYGYDHAKSPDNEDARPSELYPYDEPSRKRKRVGSGSSTTTPTIKQVRFADDEQQIDRPEEVDVPTFHHKPPQTGTGKNTKNTKGPAKKVDKGKRQSSTTTNKGNAKAKINANANAKAQAKGPGKGKVQKKKGHGQGQPRQPSNEINEIHEENPMNLHPNINTTTTAAAKPWAMAMPPFTSTSTSTPYPSVYNPQSQSHYPPPH
ncbi:hypothetical protein MMC24_005160 [Lignoscripta atroalba]|nr:hypothetical protein [Lignoscripta atroalba]